MNNIEELIDDRETIGDGDTDDNLWKSGIYQF